MIDQCTNSSNIYSSTCSSGTINNPCQWLLKNTDINNITLETKVNNIAHNLRKITNSSDSGNSSDLSDSSDLIRRKNLYAFLAGGAVLTTLACWCNVKFNDPLVSLKIRLLRDPVLQRPDFKSRIMSYMEGRHYKGEVKDKVTHPLIFVEDIGDSSEDRPELSDTLESTGRGAK